MMNMKTKASMKSELENENTMIALKLKQTEARLKSGRSAKVEEKDQDEISPEELAQLEAELKELNARPEPPIREVTTREAYDGNTALNLYLREISETPLLTIEEENELADRIKAGDEDARQHMIKANLRLVVKIAKDYEAYGLSLLDLINEGNLGLMKAVERFDPNKGGKMSTYSAWWIKQSVKRALANQSKTIRLPVHMVGKISRMRRASMRLHEEFGREPTAEELADDLDLSVSKVQQMKTASIRPTSLDAPLGDEDESRFSDIIPDDKASTPYDLLEDKTLKKLLGECLKHLDAREKMILRHRFGLDEAQELTLEEVGHQFGVTRERIRQLQNAALKKLRRLIEEHEAIQISA